jgi:hypothetical protein
MLAPLGVDLANYLGLVDLFRLGGVTSLASKISPSNPDNGYGRENWSIHLFRMSTSFSVGSECHIAVRSLVLFNKIIKALQPR